MKLLTPFPSRPTGHLIVNVLRRGVLDDVWELAEEFAGPNLVVNTGRQIQARLLGGDTTRVITTIGFGSNAAAPVAGNTALTNALLKPHGGATYPADNQVRFAFSLGAGEGNGLAISEFGLFAANGSLYARKTRATPLNKDSDLALSGTWTITF